MRFAIIQVVNGNFSIVSEHGDNLQAARVAFHERCKILWNAPDVERAVVELVDSDLNVYTGYVERDVVELVDSDLNVYTGYREFIGHDPVETEE